MGERFSIPRTSQPDESAGALNRHLTAPEIPTGQQTLVNGPAHPFVHAQPTTGLPATVGRTIEAFPATAVSVKTPSRDLTVEPGAGSSFNFNAPSANPFAHAPIKIDLVLPKLAPQTSDIPIVGPVHHLPFNTDDRRGNHNRNGVIEPVVTVGRPHLTHPEHPIHFAPLPTASGFPKFHAEPLPRVSALPTLTPIEHHVSAPVKRRHPEASATAAPTATPFKPPTEGGGPAPTATPEPIKPSPVQSSSPPTEGGNHPTPMPTMPPTEGGNPHHIPMAIKMPNLPASPFTFYQWPKEPPVTTTITSMASSMWEKISNPPAQKPANDHIPCIGALPKHPKVHHIHVHHPIEHHLVQHENPQQPITRLTPTEPQPLPKHKPTPSAVLVEKHKHERVTAAPSTVEFHPKTHERTNLVPELSHAPTVHPKHILNVPPLEHHPIVHKAPTHQPHKILPVLPGTADCPPPVKADLHPAAPVITSGEYTTTSEKTTTRKRIDATVGANNQGTVTGSASYELDSRNTVGADVVVGAHGLGEGDVYVHHQILSTYKSDGTPNRVTLGAGVNLNSAIGPNQYDSTNKPISGGAGVGVTADASLQVGRDPNSRIVLQAQEDLLHRIREQNGIVGYTREIGKVQALVGVQDSAVSGYRASLGAQAGAEIPLSARTALSAQIVLPLSKGSKPTSEIGVNFKI